MKISVPCNAAPGVCSSDRDWGVGRLIPCSVMEEVIRRLMFPLASRGHYFRDVRGKFSIVHIPLLFAGERGFKFTPPIPKYFTK